jgi:hypothetical protein
MTNQEADAKERQDLLLRQNIYIVEAAWTNREGGKITISQEQSIASSNYQ